MALAALFAGHLSAQALLGVDGVAIIRDDRAVGRMSSQLPVYPSVQTAVCNNDTLAYALNKASSLQVVNMNSGSSATSFGQYYDAPQPMLISQLRFFAYKINAVGGISTNVVVELYNARPDSLPMGVPLRTAIIPVDTNFHAGSLSGLEKVVTFATPVLVSNSYVVVVRNNTPNPVGLVVSDYQAADGADEWLACAQVNGLWRHSYQLNVSGTPFNCDALIDPVVSYTIKADFNNIPGCVAAAGNVNFENESSPIFEHRMYNVAAFLGYKGYSFVWNFGDGTGSLRQVTSTDTTHYYAAGGTYAVSLHDTMFGWSVTSATDTSIALGQAPEPMFTHMSTALVVQFTDQSSQAAVAWLWDFGDGNTSTQQNPIHTYAAAGTYQVCLWSTNQCGTDSMCHTIVLTCAAPVAAFSSAANNYTVDFTDWSTGNPNAWLWSFGDGGTSTQQNPTHVYTADGNYLVCLKAFSPCGMDSSWFWVAVTCAQPTSIFSFTSNLLTVDFTNLSLGDVVAWHWSFGDTNTSTDPNPTHTYAAPGTYLACLKVLTDCGQDSSCFEVTVTGVGVGGALSDDRVEVYPNPATHALQVNTHFESSDAVTMEVLDLLGSVLRHVDLGTHAPTQYVLDVQDLATGSYLLRFQTVEGHVVKRFQVLR